MKTIFNNNNNFFLKQLIKKTLLKAQKLNKLPQNICVSISFVEQEDIKKLNNKFRNVDKATDVLSFPIINNIKDIEKQEVSPDTNLIDIGDIVICLDIAKKQATEYKHSIKREICFLALHGFLHLIGFDHIEKQDELLMIEMQNKVLDSIKVKRK